MRSGIFLKNSLDGRLKEALIIPNLVLECLLKEKPESHQFTSTIDALQQSADSSGAESC